MKHEEKKDASEEASDRVLGAVDRIIPGFQSLFKKAEESGTFGSRIRNIRKEMGRRFGRVKK